MATHPWLPTLLTELSRTATAKKNLYQLLNQQWNGEELWLQLAPARVPIVAFVDGEIGHYSVV
jgi:hypothetical protein